MPIKYEYDQKLNIVHTNPYGEVSVSEIDTYFKKLSSDPQIADGFVEVVHFEKVDKFIFSSDQATSIARIFGELKVQKGVSSTIFIGATDLHYGIGRLFQTLMELSSLDHVVYVIRNAEEAGRAFKDIIG